MVQTNRKYAAKKFSPRQRCKVKHTSRLCAEGLSPKSCQNRLEEEEQNRTHTHILLLLLERSDSERRRPSQQDNPLRNQYSTGPFAFAALATSPRWQVVFMASSSSSLQCNSDFDEIGMQAGEDYSTIIRTVSTLTVLSIASAWNNWTKIRRLSLFCAHWLRYACASFAP